MDGVTRFLFKDRNRLNRLNLRIFRTYKQTFLAPKNSEIAFCKAEVSSTRTSYVDK